MIRVPGPALEPGEALARLARGERPFLLDGGVEADGLGRYSLAGCDPDDGVTWRRGDAGDALSLLEAAAKRWSGGPVDDKPWPVAVGFLSYDLGELLSARRPFSSVDDLGLPLCDFARYRAVWRWDRAERRAEVLATDARAAEQLLGRLSRAPLPPSAPRLGEVRWETPDARYRERVARVLEYLRAGDCYQVNISHRVRVALDELGVLPVYLRLRQVAPAPLGAFLSLGAGAAILSNTPELFLRAQGTRLETRPIKGTRPRGASEADDARLREELAASAKDHAEHLMIVDLERNDLGRVAETGSVAVDGFARAVTLPTVHHLVSTVHARRAAGAGLADLLRATFPGGSVTGAPKVRAMEIIDELEGVRRGPYCGAIGWIGAGGRFDLALAIRTAVWRAGELLLSVGGGIVADSTPGDELEETRVKAAAFLRALA